MDPQTPTDAPPQPATPPTAPPPAPQTQPDQSAQYWQSQHDQLKSQTTQQITQLQQQLNQLQTAQQPPQTPTPTDTPSKVDWNTLSVAQMRAEDGSMRPEFSKAIFNKDVPDQVRNDYWQTINQAQDIVTGYANQAKMQTFGSEDAYQAALTWSKDPNNMPAYESQALHAALNNAALMGDALVNLKNKAEAAGVFAQQPQSTEPAPMPTGQPQPSTTLTPLIPGSPEAVDAVNDPKYRTDPLYQKQVEDRLRLGDKQPKGMDWGIGQ